MKLFSQGWRIFVRNFRIWITNPGAVLPNLIINILFFIIFGAAFSSVTQLPGFGGDNYYSFYLPMILVQAVVFTSGDSGFAMLTDILSGYFDKLLLAPINRFSILLGSILTTSARMIIMTAVVIILAYAFGVRYETGILGVLVSLVMCIFFGIAWSMLGIMIALRTKSVQATQSSFVVFFPFLFLTSGFLPKDLLTGWFKVAVNLNPVNYVLESLRALVLTGWDWGTLGPGLGVLVVSTVLLTGVTTYLYRKATA